MIYLAMGLRNAGAGIALLHFTVVPANDDGWYCQGARHWNLDRPDPRQPGPR